MGRYETLCLELGESALKSGLIVVDGGAHIGLDTIIASRPKDLCQELERLRFRAHFIDARTRALTPLAETGAMRKGNLFCRRDA